MTPEVAKALEREFGYVPDEDRGEKWVVFKGVRLIVTHPDDLPRVYSRGMRGSYFEFDPVPYL